MLQGLVIALAPSAPAAADDLPSSLVFEEGGEPNIGSSSKAVRRCSPL